MLLLGVDPPTLQAAPALGIDVVAVEGAAGRDAGVKVAPAGVPVVFVDDLASVEQVYAALDRSGRLAAAFDAVVTAEELAVVTAAVLAGELGARGHLPRTTLSYRDKALQKARVREAGIPTADAFVIDDVRQPGELPELAHDVVVKPVAGVGTRFTRRVPGGYLAPTLADLARSRDCPRTLLVERHVAGDEWHADGIVFGGAARFVSLTRYGQPCLEAVAGNRPVRNFTLDPVDDGWAYDLAVPVVEAALAALGPLDGAFHLELFVDDGRVTFGECGARRGGGMIQEEVAVKYGVDLAGAALAAAVGWEPDLRVTRNPRAVGSTLLPCPAGVLLAAPGEKEIRAQEGVEVAVVHMPSGYATPSSPPDAIFKVGAACVSAPDRARLETRLDELVAWFAARVRVAPPNATRSELWRLPRDPSAG